MLNPVVASKTFAVSFAYTSDCLAFFKINDNNKLEFINKIYKEDNTGEWNKGIGGFVVHNNTILAISGRGASADLSCFRLIKQNNHYRIVDAVHHRDIGNNMHNMSILDDNGEGIYDVALVNSYHDNVLRIKYDMNAQKILSKPEILVHDQQPTIKDYHHFNSVNTYKKENGEICIYVCAGKYGQSQKMTSKIMEYNLTTKTKTWLHIQKPDKTEYNFCHDFYMIGPNEYVVCESMGSKFWVVKKDIVRHIDTHGWSRGLVLLPDGGYLVGVSAYHISSPRARMTPDPMDIKQSVVLRLDKDLNQADQLVMPPEISVVSSIYDINYIYI